MRGADTQLSGVTYRPLADVAAVYGMKVGPVTGGKTVRLQNDYCTIECTAGERSLDLNGQPMALGFAILNRGGVFYLSKSDFDNNIFPLLSPGQIPGVPALRRIVLDPGHGAKDLGTSNDELRTNEKTNTLDTALRLAALLRQRGYEVFLTRTTDVFIELTERTAIANQAKADLYLSIHFNNAPQKSVTGIETYILPPPWQPPTNVAALREVDKQVLPGDRFDFWNTIVAFSVQRSVARELDDTNRGIKREHLVVLKGLNMPGLLVECGFLSSPSEGAKILQGDYRQKIAVALADGIDLYKSTLDHLRPSAPKLPPSPAAPLRHPEWMNEISLPR